MPLLLCPAAQTIMTNLEALMKIERTENGINWTDEGGGGGIHLVPMVYVSDTDPEAYQKYLEHIAKRMIPVPHTVEETLAYLQQKYPCIPLEPGHEIRLAFQYNVLRSCLEKKNASDTLRFSMDMSDEAFAALLEEEARRRQEAIDARPEDFGLRLPQTALLPRSKFRPFCRTKTRGGRSASYLCEAPPGTPGCHAAK